MGERATVARGAAGTSATRRRTRAVRLARHDWFALGLEANLLGKRWVWTSRGDGGDATELGGAAEDGAGVGRGGE